MITFSFTCAISQKRAFIIVPCPIWHLLPSFPQVEALKLIYSQILEQHVTDPREKFHPAVQKFVGPLINTALFLHDKVSATFLPTVAKFHYMFNLRDLTNIFQVRNARERERDLNDCNVFLKINIISRRECCLSTVTSYHFRVT